MSQAAKTIDGLLRPPPEPNTASYGEYLTNPEKGNLVSLDGEEATIPAGFSKLLMQPRQCGDFYAELVGSKSVSGFGATQIDAPRSVIAAAPVPA